jgi:hypothetical protein
MLENLALATQCIFMIMEKVVGGDGIAFPQWILLIWFLFEDTMEREADLWKDSSVDYLRNAMQVNLTTYSR